MKKIFGILFALTLIITSCNNDDSSSGNNNSGVLRSKVIGHWKIVGYSDRNGNELSDLDRKEECGSKMTFEFIEGSVLNNYYYRGENCDIRNLEVKTYLTENNTLYFVVVNGGQLPNTDFVQEFNVNHIDSKNMEITLKAVYNGTSEESVLVPADVFTYKLQKI